MLGELIPEPKPRSKAWLSTSFPMDSDAAAAAACGPDYHVLPRWQLNQILPATVGVRGCITEAFELSCAFPYNYGFTRCLSS